MLKKFESERAEWRAIAARLAARLMSKPYDEFDRNVLQDYLNLQEKKRCVMFDVNSLSRRATKCRKWKWVDGMVSDDRFAPLDVRLPDFSNENTVEFLAQIVRDAWGDPCAAAFAAINEEEKQLWVFCTTKTTVAFVGDSKVEALVLGLENAP